MALRRFGNWIQRTQRRQILWLGKPERRGYLVLAIVLIFAVPLYWYQHAQDQRRTQLELGVVRDDHNALICVFRRYIIPQRARSIQASKDLSQSKSARKRAQDAVNSSDDFLDSLITIPPDYICPPRKATHQ